MFIVISKLIEQMQDAVSEYAVQHDIRNDYNILPVGRLTLTSKKYHYVDDGGVVWYKRGFLQSLFHDPFKQFTFETVDMYSDSSSESRILKSNFYKGLFLFVPGSFNYYSSIKFPLKHLIYDFMPLVLSRVGLLHVTNIRKK